VNAARAAKDALVTHRSFVAGKAVQHTVVADDEFPIMVRIGIEGLDAGGVLLPMSLVSPTAGKQHHMK